MNSNTTTKGFIGLVTGVLGYLAGCLNEMIIILIGLAIMDYVLGIVAAFFSGKKFDTKTAIKGAVKKALYAFVIALGYFGDYLILFLASMFGIEMPVKAMLGLVVTLYTVGTEGASCIKNILIIGVPAPEAILKFFDLIKDQSGKIVPIPEAKEAAGNAEN